MQLLTIPILVCALLANHATFVNADDDLYGALAKANLKQMKSVIEARPVPETADRPKKDPKLGNSFSRLFDSTPKDTDVDSITMNDTQYDLVFDCDSLQQIGREGWSVHVRDNRTIAALNETSHRSLVVSVMGLYSKGKTHITNRIARKSFETGLATHTKGLSVTLPRDRENIMFP